MATSLKNAFGAVTVAGLSTFNMVAANAYEQDDLVSDILNDMSNRGVVSDIVHEAIENPLADYIDFNDEVANIIGAANVESGDNFLMDNGNFLSFGGPVQSIAPDAFQAYCELLPEDCAMTAEEYDMVQGGENIQAVRDLNADFSTNFLYIGDEENYGRLEDFRPAPLADDVHKKVYADDCDGYALRLMQKMNTELGVPVSAMSMVVVDPNIPDGNSLHALLMVRTGEGDILLDMDGSSKFPNETNYTFMQGMSMTDKAVWQGVTPTPFGVEASMYEFPDRSSAMEAKISPPIPQMRPADL